MDVQQSKSEVRRRVRAVLKELNPQRRVEESVRARGRLREQKVWDEAKSVFLYAPLAEELDIWPMGLELVRSGKTVALPRYDAQADRYLACRIDDFEKDVVAGKFGVREPASHCAVLDPGRLELILVPGVAFDVSGRRLGRGKGFYDRMLPSLNGITCGIAFDEQIVPEIPFEEHDIRVGYVLTPSRWVKAG